MRKVSEVLKLALPRYEYEQYRLGSGRAYMCLVAKDMGNAGEITDEELYYVLAAINRRLQGSATLYTYLRRNRQPNDLAARVEWYRDWIVELEGEGK